MSTQVWLAIITGLLGLLAAGILALLNSWIGTRSGIDENLRSQRLELYPGLWNATAAVSRWPRVDLTRSTLEELHRSLRSWYYAKGGIFLSGPARERYGDVQKLIGALLTHNGNADDVLAEDRYTDLMKTASSLRTALTQDLDTRRRKSFWDTRRRARWHADEAKKAQTRIARATASALTWEHRETSSATRADGARAVPDRTVIES
jgi:hypothetical protein